MEQLCALSREKVALDVVPTIFKFQKNKKKRKKHKIDVQILILRR